MTILNAYINFKDKAKEAMTFYQTVLGGELTMTTFNEGGMSQSDGDANLIMHSMLKTDSGLVLMGSDIPPSMQTNDTLHKGMGLSLSGEDEVELKGYWEKLSEGATITMPLEKAPWGDQFGMLTDKFGIDWMVNINAPKVMAA